MKSIETTEDGVKDLLTVLSSECTKDFLVYPVFTRRTS
jgi:hypothetical protein